jgi:hypothetical protein
MTNSNPTFTLLISAYGGWDFDRERGSMTRVVFSDDATAADYITRKGYLVLEPEAGEDGYPAIPEGWDLTMGALFPTCEHGMDARNCAGPMHFLDAAQERALFG